ncbi:MAG: hypothetical protein QOF88_6916 [Mycobacterium sp.]|jgi:uncharacterized protein (DUF302 family)|nr:hypothetical protein [Mycobacterium sp.]
MTTLPIATVHTMTRLDIPTAIAFDEFRDAFEGAAPVFNIDAVNDITARGGTWDDVRAAVASNAPHGLMTFATIDAAPLMAAAGHQTKAVEYLLGNHVVAEQMFRHDPLALLYAPLRILIHSDTNNEAIFSLDQPSTVFESLEDSAITTVGRDLDDKVITLLKVIGVDAQAAFSRRH